MSSVRIYHKTNIFIHCKQRTILRALSSFVYPLAVLNHHLSAAKIVFGMPLTHHTNSLPRLVMHRQARSLLSGSIVVYAFSLYSVIPLSEVSFIRGTDEEHDTPQSFARQPLREDDNMLADLATSLKIACCVP